MVFEYGNEHISGNFTFQSGYIQINRVSTRRLIDVAFTFQSGYIQIFRNKQVYCRRVHLYIPIWLYSNIYKRGLGVYKTELYIPIWLYSNVLRASVRGQTNVSFTFQSGYIQIGINIIKLVSGRPLHSNLVIFK